MKNTIVPVIICSTLLLGGCVFAPSGGDEGLYGARAQVQPTLGQELIDLDRARDAGIISEAEYERARTRLLEGRNQ